MLRSIPCNTQHNTYSEGQNTGLTRKERLKLQVSRTWGRQKEERKDKEYRIGGKQQQWLPRKPYSGPMRKARGREHKPTQGQWARLKRAGNCRMETTPNFKSRVGICKRSRCKAKHNIMTLLDVGEHDAGRQYSKLDKKKTLFYVRVTNCPGLPRAVSALALKFLHPRKPLSPRQTRATEHPSCKD